LSLRGGSHEAARRTAHRETVKQTLHKNSSGCNQSPVMRGPELRRRSLGVRPSRFGGGRSGGPTASLQPTRRVGRTTVLGVRPTTQACAVDPAADHEEGLGRRRGVHSQQGWRIEVAEVPHYDGRLKRHQ
jgi:hypothetical protein